MTDIDNAINNVSETIILNLNGCSLFDYYLDIYRTHFFRETGWEKRKEVKKLIKFFEYICLSNIKKFRFLSIIQFDVMAFKHLIDVSNVLKEDEEIMEYFNLLVKIDDKFRFFSDLEKDVANTLHKIKNENEMLKKDVKDLTYRVNKLKKGSFF